MNNQTTKKEPWASARNQALFACRQLVGAYRRGARNGGSVDWNDINDAWQTAKAALRLEKKEAKKS